MLNTFKTINHEIDFFSTFFNSSADCIKLAHTLEQLERHCQLYYPVDFAPNERECFVLVRDFCAAIRRTASMQKQKRYEAARHYLFTFIDKKGYAAVADSIWHTFNISFFQCHIFVDEDVRCYTGVLIALWEELESVKKY